MISTIRDLVASDPDMLPRVLDLSAKSNAEQINAIGAGLGQAALVCSRGDPTFANEIQQMVAAVNNQPLTLTFAGVVGNSPVAAAGSRDVKNTGDAGAVPSASRNGGIASPANALTGQPGSSFFTAPPGSPGTEALNQSQAGAVGANALGPTASTNPGTSATQGVTSALGVPTGTTATGTGSTGATGSGPTTTGTTTVPGALATTTGPSTTEATTTGTTSSPALSTAAGIVTGLASAQTTGTSNTIGATNPLATTPIGTTTPGAPSSTSPTTPTTAITPMTAISTVATGATSSASTTGASATTTAGITTGFIGGTGTLSQTTVAPTSFFTLDFNAKGQPVVGGTKNASSWRSVSPSQ